MAYTPNNPNGQATMANSAPVVIASDQSALDVNISAPISVSGTIPTTISSGTITTVTNAVSVSGTIPVSGVFYQATQPVSGTVSVSGTIPTTISSGTISTITNSVTVAQATATNLRTQAEVYQGGTAVSTSNQLQVASSASTATVSSVSASATSITILASNASRKGAMFFNDSNQTLYLLFGSGVASTTNYSVRIPSNSYFDIDFPVYTGQLNGIWNSANGSVKVTELT